MKKSPIDETQSLRFGALANVPKTNLKVITRMATWLPSAIAYRDVALACPIVGRSTFLDKARHRFFSRQLLGLAFIF